MHSATEGIGFPAMDIDNAPTRLRSLPSWLLVQGAVRAGRLIADEAANLGVSKAAYPALATLDEFGPSSQAQLGRRLGIDRKDISELAAELERTGAVRRGPDPIDKRRNQLEITSAGQALLERLDAAFAEVQNELLVALSQRDRSDLTRLLSAIVSSPT
jgi:DNA-binding MarR family transcriptional regulator